jgi:putative ABC transport system permease protein
MSAFLQVSPILAALRKHKAAVILLVLEIALTTAILGNLTFIVHGGIQRSAIATGATEGQLGIIQTVSAVGIQNSSTTGGNLVVLRGVPGVMEAAYSVGAPLRYLERDPVFIDPSRQQQLGQMYEFQGSQGLSKTLGVNIVQGHDFSNDELPVVGDMSATGPVPALMTRALANHLYPDGNALGRIFYDGNASGRVIGIVDHLRGEITGRDDDDYGVLFEYLFGPQNSGGIFLVKTQPGVLPEALRAAAAALAKANPGHVQTKVVTMPELREDYFRGDLAVGHMLISIMLILLIITTLGVAGLASFWVQQRRRQIGVRRALGATRSDILRYFQIENFLIVTGGLLLGVFFAYGLNTFLMDHFELERLPATYLLIGTVALWVLGQLAVLGPALRAAAIPPVAATRPA